MTDTKEIIMKLKEVKQAKNLSLTDIVEMTGNFVSKTTVQRVFADGSEENSFRYEETIRPIATALLDIDNMEETDNSDIQAMKTILKYKMERIEELELQISKLESEFNKEKLRNLERIEQERTQYEKKIDFLKEQISLKDRRMDQLLEAVFQKDKQMKDFYESIIKGSK